MTAKIKTDKKKTPLSFEQSITELENIVHNLEQGELSLEDSINLFERGLSLSKFSQETLQQAEQKVKILLEQNGQQTLVDFDLDKSDVVGQ